MRINLRGLFLALTAFAVMLGMWRLTYNGLQAGYRHYTSSDPAPRTLGQLVRLDLPRDIKEQEARADRSDRREYFRRDYFPLPL